MADGDPQWFGLLTFFHQGFVLDPAVNTTGVTVTNGGRGVLGF